MTRTSLRPPVGDQPAGLGRRFVAVAVDQVLVLLLGGGLVVLALADAVRAVVGGAEPGSVAGAVPVPLLVAGTVVAAVLTLVQWLLHGRLGWTLGRLLLGVRTVDADARTPVGAWRVLVRGLVVAAGSLACGVGQLVVLASPLLDRTGRRRGWHDQAVGAEVLRVDRQEAARRAARAGARARGSDGPGLVPPVPGVGDVVPVPARAVPAQAVVAGAGLPAAGPRTPSGGVPTATGALRLAPLHQQRSGPDLDTRAVPLVRPGSPDLVFGLAPELEMTRPAPPRADVRPVQPEPGARGARLAFDDGRVVVVETSALVGRNPAPAPGVQVVRVMDPGRSVSKTHLQVGVDADGAWVADRGSTNGTVVTLPDGQQVVCRVDHPVRLRPGATVQLGDCTFRVLAVPAGGGRASVP
ncbi:RDD family protein [Cellulomonas oligotrophica]|uniref:FHA domain-containing protein n=1 Tax=Cellulomonas oligotrophica TaxID=931536 RepID=A0A7Y9FFI1_9CELL|nr:RDD family protein [Cellulomonas oligotrophica]NYD85081.1 hypothetical protein [Cellulomonas oligotrophica]GIG33786.1 hypothetical protein Col01nite_29450 [Cellulomonas oligotrophica]